MVKTELKEEEITDLTTELGDLSYRQRYFTQFLMFTFSQTPTEYFNFLKHIAHKILHLWALDIKNML